MTLIDTARPSISADQALGIVHARLITLSSVRFMISLPEGSGSLY
jgi:hypothetical protein